MVHLGVCLTCLRSLVTEANLNLCAFLPRLLRLNPELVVPSRGITLGVSNSTVNNEYIVTVNVLDCSREWVRTASLVYIGTLLLSPCTNLEVILHIIVLHVSKTKFFPSLVSSTILKLLKPCDRLLWLRVVTNDDILPLDNSSSVRLCDKITSSTANAREIHLNLSPFSANV